MSRVNKTRKRPQFRKFSIIQIMENRKWKFQEILTVAGEFKRDSYLKEEKYRRTREK